MNWEIIINVIEIVGIIGLGALSLYVKYNSKLSKNVTEFIAAAEDEYKDVTKAGGEKFTWVVDKLYGLIPAPFQLFFTKETIEKLVQKTFDSIESFAKAQLDKGVDKLIK